MAEFQLDALGRNRFRVAGDLTFSTVASLVSRFDNEFGKGDLLVDLSGVSHADSASLALLMEWERRAVANGTELRYSGLPSQMESIAQLSDLSDALPLASA